MNRKHLDIIGHLGQRSFGEVYKVKYLTNGKIYAMKVTAALTASQLNTEFREIQILSKMNHKNIVKYITSFQKNVGGRKIKLEIIMEYYGGGDLATYLDLLAKKNQVLTFDRLMGLFNQLVSALIHIKEKQIIHRDIKPANIFLNSSKNSVKLGDFGLSKKVRNYDVTHTIAGTLRYMSPEMLLQKKYDHSTDIWSLGCVFYEIVTLRHPFGTSSINTIESMKNIISGNYSPLNRDWIEACKFDFQFIEFMLKIMLEVNPHKRASAAYLFKFTNPIAVIKDLEAQNSRLKSKAHKPSKVTKNLENVKWINSSRCKIAAANILNNIYL